MKKRFALWAASVAVTLSGLTMALWARPQGPPAAPEAEAAPKAAASRITHVTVYPNSALVTREVQVPAGTGSLELVVTPLPQHTVNSSLYSEGGDGIRVLTTRFRTRPVKEDTREEVRKLENDIKAMHQKTQQLQAELNANTQNTALLGKLENFTAASTQHATEKGKLDSDATIALAKYLMEGRGEKTKEMVALQQKIQDNQEQIEFANRKLREMTAGSSKTEFDAVIVVDKANAAAGKIKLNYLVDSAAWRPQYKLRAGKEMKDAVQLEYLAAIIQQTGEDWQGVEMRLSTAQPMLNATPPELKMLAVAVVPKAALASTAPAGAGGPGGAPGQPTAPAPAGGMGMGRSGTQLGLRFGGMGGMGGTGSNMRPGEGPGNNIDTTIPNPQGIANTFEVNEALKSLRQQAQQEGNRKNDNNSAEIWNYAGALEQARDLVLADEQKAVAGKRLPPRAENHEGPSVTYQLPSRLSVPSRNDEQVLEVARIDMQPEYFYKAVPVLTPHVYRQANLTNKSKYILLPGEGTMYNGTDFVGRMNLPLVAIGETFTAGFGTDPQLQVQRAMTEKTRSMQGGNQILAYQYRILMSSYKTERVKVQLWDRLPQAENETMGVNLVKASPEVSKDPLYVREEKPHNLLRWDLDLDPDMSGEKALMVQYEFKLELDKNMTIGSFQSK
jgi:hypothetical protein